MTTIYEVAEKAGVSITTVSHVFSGRRPVAPDTQKRVLEVARKLSYRPRLTAQGLARGRSMILGIHFPFEGELFIRNPYFPELLEGLSTAAAKAGYGFLLIPRSLDQPDFGPEDLLNRLDGVVIVDPEPDDPQMPAILEYGLPVVTTGRHPEHDTIPWVDNDHPAGIVQLFEHFDRQGYARPALISTQIRLSYIGDVEGAFEAEASARNMPALIARPVDLSEQRAYSEALDMLQLASPPDAIIATTDHQAVAVLRATQELGLRVPRDLGIAGEGDTVLAYNAIPPLTSIAVYPRKIGEAALELMLAILDDRWEAENRLIQPKLVERASTLRDASHATGPDENST